ncbi:MAG: hypothetical protein HUK08_08350 [Bacteroidaceae bacterium]|nr:hypothetical protein [Bacteroidaceae bacterium]
MSFLLIAEIPMFSLKFKHLNYADNKLRFWFVLSCIPIIVIFRLSSFAVIIAWYVILSAFSDIRSCRELD